MRPQLLKDSLLIQSAKNLLRAGSSFLNSTINFYCYSPCAIGGAFDTFDTLALLVRFSTSNILYRIIHQMRFYSPLVIDRHPVRPIVAIGNYALGFSWQLGFDWEERKCEFGWVRRERYQVPGGCKRYLWWSSSRSPGRDAVNASFTWATIVCPGSKTHLNIYILWNTLLHLNFCITSVSASDPIMSVHSFPEDFIHYLGFRRSGVTCRDAKVNQL